MHASRAGVVGLKTTWPCSSPLPSYGETPPDNYANGTRDVRWKCHENSSRDCASRIPPRCFSLRCRSLTAVHSYSLVALLLSVTTDSKVEFPIIKQPKNGRDTTLARIYLATKHFFCNCYVALYPTYASCSRRILIFSLLQTHICVQQELSMWITRIGNGFYRIHAT